MKLYIRHRKSIWINFIHDIQEFREFEDNFIEGRKLVIGDLAQFSKPMVYRLLKFIEAHPEVDCYSSMDIDDPILLSRFVEIVKEPLEITQTHSFEDFNNSANDYTSVVSMLSDIPTDLQLRIPHSRQSSIKLIEKL